MLVKAMRDGIYQNTYYAEGREVNFEGKNIPCWCEKVKKEKSVQPTEPTTPPGPTEPTEPTTPTEPIEPTEEEITEKYENYKLIAFENNILLNIEKLTKEEAIKKFEKEFETKGIKYNG